MKKNIFVLTLLMSFAFSGYCEEIAKIVAKVNNEVITNKDLDDYSKMIAYRMPDLAKDFSVNDEKGKLEALDKLIEDKLILDEAKKRNLEVVPTLVMNQLNKIISSYPSREDFDNSLVERGLNITLLKERIKGQFLMRQVIDNFVSTYVTVSPQEICQYYNEHKNEIKSTPVYVIWTLQTKDKNLLGAVTKTLKERGIIETDKEYPDKLIKVEASIKDLKDEIVQMLKDLKEGEHAVKKIDDSNYFVYLEKIEPIKPLSLEEARDTIYNSIWNEKFKKRFEDWVKQLKEKAVVKVYL